MWSSRSSLLAAICVFVVGGAAGLRAAQTAPAPAGSVGERSVLYAAAGPELIRYEVQAGEPALVEKEAVTLPGNIQYAWPHPSRRYLYVAWSNGPAAHPHGLAAFSIDGASGSLRPLGLPVYLAARSIHLTTDADGTHLLVASNVPSALTVHRLEPDGAIGAEVKQPALDTGVYAHQVRVHPLNRAVLLVARGNVAESGKPEDPGALKIYSYESGRLGNRASVAPGGGFGFQPRHLDFHPSGKWVFVSLEPQNLLQVFKETGGGLLENNPIFSKPSLASPPPDRAGLYQRSGTVHVHPNGRFVYQADRVTDAGDSPGTGAWGGGANAIGVFTINQETGEPTLIQTAETHGIVPRTFSLDATGTLLVAANQNRVEVRNGSQQSVIAPCLSVFRVLVNGKLDFVRKYDVRPRGNASLYWMGIVSLPH